MDTEFARHLARFGPDAPGYPLSPARAQAYCSRLARRHYENFTVASLLLPRHLMLYTRARGYYVERARRAAPSLARG